VFDRILSPMRAALREGLVWFVVLTGFYFALISSYDWPEIVVGLGSGAIGAQTVAACPDGTGVGCPFPGVRSAPAASSALRVRPTTSSRTPRAATSIARANPRRVKRPWATTPSWRKPSM